ncbi:MAG: hypothetical protein PHV18_15465 [Lachnospiraceae bacterium]|nr:hypothetical protein [Lachnospiraceae bacterium]
MRKMRRADAAAIARRAASLAEDECNSYDACYQEYIDQLRSNDFGCLRTWLGWMIECGNREATRTMKMLIRAELGIAAA